VSFVIIGDVTKYFKNIYMGLFRKGKELEVL
jgi:hypothetical protein